MLRSLLLLAVAALLAAPADAQSVRHRILVTKAGPACHYQIATQSNQELFVVSPGDRLRLQGLAGTKARFEFMPDGEVVPLARSSQNVDVRGNGETVTVRGARGADSEHEVAIRCCMDRQGNTCKAWTRATPAADLGMAPAPLPGDAVTGPAAPPAPQADPRLGPRMKVDE